MSLPGPMIQSPRFAAVIDLENLAIAHGRRLSTDETRRLLSSFAPQVSNMPVRVASGERILCPNMSALDPTWGLSLASTEPDAADHLLIGAAHNFIACGVSDLVVASGDHAFVPLAAFARLHVVSHADHLSRELRMAATTVTYLSTSPARTLIEGGVAS